MTDFNVKSSTLEKGLDLIKDFLERLIGPSIDEIGLAYQDNWRFWRLKKQLKFLNKAKELVDKNGISIKRIDLKALVPLLEGVSLEENEDLQQMWTNLFLNYIDSDKNLTINVYPEILKQLSTNEVRILVFMSNNNNSFFPKDNDVFPASNFNYETAELANLHRLGVIDAGASHRVSDSVGEKTFTSKFLISAFGQSFLAACKR